ncbi:hypothetical protein ZRA01_23680 [Zoogloea ramigera]|uniref:Uncharacterized protein n=1 Tax=Zoogloea ramigera TaxID=350 RepID=A0A4Y4CTL1_ZOORA|nr:hypothetical protein ZRA01_23680 [Zoogloea ramigera]
MTAFRNLKNRMSKRFRTFADAHPEGDSATRPLARLRGRLALSLRLAGMSLPRCREKAPGRPKLSRGPLGGQERRIAASPGVELFAPDTRPDAPASASNYRF